jgi:hypothetical protein
MTRQQEMEMEIADWVETLGYDQVLDALITTCQYWATTGDTPDNPPIEGPGELWAKRERALRHAQREGELP